MTTACDLPIDLSTKSQHHHGHHHHHHRHHHHHHLGHHQLDHEQLQQLQLEYLSHQQLSAALANHPLNRLYAASQQHQHHRHHLEQLEQLEIQLGNHPFSSTSHHHHHNNNNNHHHHHQQHQTGGGQPTGLISPHSPSPLALAAHQQHQQQQLAAAAAAASQASHLSQHHHHLQLAQHLQQQQQHQQLQHQLQLSESQHHLQLAQHHHHQQQLGHHHHLHNHHLGHLHHHHQLQDLSASAAALSGASLASSASLSSSSSSSSSASTSSLSSSASSASSTSSLSSAGSSASPNSSAASTSSVTSAHSASGHSSEAQLVSGQIGSGEQQQQQQQSSSPPAHQLSQHLSLHHHHQNHLPGESNEENPSPIDLHRSSTSSTLSTLSSPSSSSASITSTSSSLNLQLNDKKRINRPLTGKHVKHGTGASMQTLATLRKTSYQHQEDQSIAGECQHEVSTEPSSRASLINLRDQLNSSLVEHQAKLVGLCPIRRSIYDQCFDELIRQVTVGCIEQGLLLFRVRNELLMTIKYYRKAYESGVNFGLNKAIDTEVKLERSKNQVCHLKKNQENLEKNLQLADRISEVGLRNKLESVDRMREYYMGELAKKDEIIEQQRAIIKALSEKGADDIRSPL